MRKVWMLAISGPCAVNNPPEYLLKATKRPAMRFQAVGQLPIRCAARSAIWCNWLSVHRHIASGHQVHGQAHSAAQPVALASGYAVRAGEVVTLGCAI